MVGFRMGSSGSSVVGASSVASGAKWFEDLGMGLVERIPWRVCLRWPLMIASEEGQLLHSVAKAEAWKGLVVACFDCSKPGGQDWFTGRSVVETDKRADTGKVIHAGGLGG